MRLYVFFYTELQNHRNLPWEGKKICKQLKKWMASVLALLLITSLLLELFGVKAYAATNYIISTVAGTGSYGYSGDGGNATSAQLNHPFGVAIDSSGNLYIADYQNNRIRKVDASGTISTVAGTGIPGYSGDGGQATSATLSNPMGVAVDDSGNLYISDTANGRIRKVDASGTISTVAGTGEYGYSGDGGPATSAQLSSPNGVATDSDGNLYIADHSNHRIRKVDGSGTISTIAGTGTRGYSGDGGAAASAELNGPNSIAVDSSGNLYIADFYNNRIRKVDALGTISTVAGIGGSGYSGDGELATSAQLNSPAGVAVDRYGNLYIADTGNYRIRKVDESGIIRTIAGTGSFGDSGDGGAATSAQLANPYGLAAASNEDLYIADVHSQRIRKLSIQAQTVSSFASTSTPMTGDDNIITLTVKNSLGNTDTSFNGVHDVTISGYSQAPDHSYGSFNGTALSESPNTISVTFASGVATANLKLNKAGAQTINISVADVASPAANSLIIMPIAGSPASMALITDIKAPASNGDTFSQQPVITLLDAYDNTSVGDNSTIVTASKKDTGAWALLGTTTATASSGIVAFTDLGATNRAVVTGAQLSFEADGLPPIESTTVTLPWEAPPDSIVDPISGIFDKNPANQADITTAVTLNGHTLVSINNGADELTVDEDYTLVGNVLTIRKEYLAQQTVGSLSLTFTFSAGSPQTLDIPIVDTTRQEQDTEAPQWPDGSKLTASDITQTSIKLSWPMATDHVGVTGYRIYMNGTERMTVSGSVYETIIVGLSADTTYTFRVTAYDAAGNESEVGLSRTATTLSRSSSGPGGGWYLSSKASLKTFEIWTDGKRLSLTPSFAVDTFSYRARTEAKQIEVRATADHAAAKVTWQEQELGGGIQIELQEGENIIPIIVQAEDGSRKTYTLVIEKVAPDPQEPKSPAASLTDIEGHWAENDIKRAAAKGIVNGYPDGAFKPNNPVTRAEFTVMLAGALKLEGEGPPLTFADHDQIGRWAKTVVAQVMQAGIVNGYEDGSFRPNVDISRAEMAVMIARALKQEHSAHASTDFADDEAIPQWAKGAIEAIRTLGIVDGRISNRFVPNETATRGEATVMLLRMLEQMENDMN
ncbi:S-layer homology domain-containing protein [Paenibacillaceae bacterium WGS1546]|uniref:NHL domain-containing protein n=1 Tax=Cohnella sp. WGS1546 TaxID=3366810 RepID=UPI00372D15A0